MSEVLEQLHDDIEVHLQRIEKLFPPSYKITLLARCAAEDLDDADIFLTVDTLTNIQSAIEKRIKNESKKVTHFGKECNLNAGEYR